MELLAEFGANLDARGISEARKRDHLRVLRQFDAFLTPRSLHDAKGPDLAAYLSKRGDDGCAPNTLRKERQMLVGVYLWAYDNHHLSADTFLSMRSVPTPAGATSRISPDPYTRKELLKFREALNLRWPLMDEERAWRFARRWREEITPYARIRKHAIHLQLDAIMSIALQCGLRRGEIFALHLDDVHYDNAYIVVDRGERWNRVYHGVPFTKVARAAVEAWIEFRSCLRVDHQHPWLNLWAEKTAREPIKPDAFAKLLSSYVAPELSYRRLRHTCGVVWLKTGMDLWVVQSILGHSTLKDTLPYAEAIKVDLEGRVKRLQGPFADAVAPAA